MPGGPPQWTDELEAGVWLTDAQVLRFAGPGPLNTDDHPLTEYFLLRLLTHDDRGFVTVPKLRAAAIGR